MCQRVVRFARVSSWLRLSHCLCGAAYVAPGLRPWLPTRFVGLRALRGNCTRVRCPGLLFSLFSSLYFVTPLFLPLIVGWQWL